tara:strand:- start:2562 stop:3827 length:1266 start_codon:yes stop_codon:yes gene_type:complete
MFKKFLKIFNRKKPSYLNSIQDLKNDPGIIHLFNSINDHTTDSEILFVGGCVRQNILGDKVEDIDLATNLDPDEVINCLNKNKIKFIDIGKKYGTITAIIEKKKFEITSLRKDIKTDGRHAEVQYCKSWKDDANRRDFTFNSIYSNLNGELFDPFNGRYDLLNGCVKFIGNPKTRVKEDYLRILRYIRFFLIYSKNNHSEEIKKIIKQNINGINKISNDRLLSELKKILLSKGLLKIPQDKFSKEIIQLIFPQLKNFEFIRKFEEKDCKSLFKDNDFPFLISLLIINETDNAEYFMHKFNLSKFEKDRILFLKNVYKNLNKDFFQKKNLKIMLYKHGRQKVIDLIKFHILRSKKVQNFDELNNFQKMEETPVFPYNAKFLKEKYNFKDGKLLGDKLKQLESVWLHNNFKLPIEKVDNILRN